LFNRLPLVWQKRWQDSEFENPTQIQELSFNILSENGNLLGVSPTGTGKTLAYLLPLLLNVEKGAGNQLLILLPSQELAMQVGKVASGWASLLELKTISLIGSANVARQVARLKARPEILIGTPGRVLELIRARKIKLMNIATIVLDEADLLLKGTAFNFTENILHYAPKTFQLAFFSATGGIVREDLAKLTKSNFEIVDVSKKNLISKNIEHFFLQVPKRKRVDALRSLNFTKDFSALVFFNEISELGATLEKLLFQGLQVASLASDQNKLFRQAALKKFRCGEVKLLLTSDVLSRGMDFKDLFFVVNFSVPRESESYLHRTGRVGRMGVKGVVVTLVSSGDDFKDYQKILQQLSLSASEIFLHGGKLVDKKQSASSVIRKKVRKQ